MAAEPVLLGPPQASQMAVMAAMERHLLYLDHPLLMREVAVEQHLVRQIRREQAEQAEEVMLFMGRVLRRDQTDLLTPAVVVAVVEAAAALAAPVS